MQVVSIISTKGGVGKTTTAANLGGLVADAGLHVLQADHHLVVAVDLQLAGRFTQPQ